MGCSNSSTAKKVTVNTVGESSNPQKQSKLNYTKYEFQDTASDENQEDSVQMMIRAEQQSLSQIAKPKIERAISCEQLLPDQISAELKLEADILRQKRRERRKTAKLEAETNQQWMIFNYIDAFDESEMDILASFLDTVLEHVRGLSSRLQKISSQELNKDDDKDQFSLHSTSDTSEMTIVMDRYNSSDRIMLKRENSKEQIIQSNRANSQGKIEIGRENSMNRLMFLEKVSIGAPLAHLPIDNPQNHSLPTGFITIKVVNEILEIYRHGGKLSVESVHKILRLAYKSLKLLPNTIKVEVTENVVLTVVGDIHGQLEDLLHIIDEVGLPSPTNKYIFNGDFVDRGPQGVEVMCILLAMYSAMPDHVVLNRGNHEDYAVCCVYGFQTECLEKYDDVTFGMFIELFQCLPLFAIINDAILVLHGGLFHDTHATLEDLAAIPRGAFSLGDSSCESQTLISSSTDRKGYLLQLQRDALWSDPAVIDGTGPSSRGAGVTFGPDVTRDFLERNKLVMIVRSHECVQNGFHQPYSGPDANILCTVFSASNYGGAGNSGAYMKFASTMMYGGVAVAGSNLFYAVSQYDYAPHAHSTTDLGSSLSIRDLIIRERPKLLLAFEAVDVRNSGFVTKVEWAEIMQRVTKVRILWSAMIRVLVPENCMKDEKIKFLPFLGSFSGHGHDDSLTPLTGNEMVDALYKQHKTLERVFFFFDNEGTGCITKEAFRQGFDLLNKTLPEEKRMYNSNEIFHLLDLDETGGVDINEFFEVSRIVDLNRNTGGVAVVVTAADTVKCDNERLPEPVVINITATSPIDL